MVNIFLPLNSDHGASNAGLMMHESFQPTPGHQGCDYDYKAANWCGMEEVGEVGFISFLNTVLLYSSLLSLACMPTQHKGYIIWHMISSIYVGPSTMRLQQV